jgi:hypothetical protein
MSTPMVRPVKVAVFGFLGLMLAAVVMAIANKTGVVEPVTAKRGFGLIIGGLAIVIGNFLPKLRLLAGDPIRTAAAERLAGWMLVLTGTADVALFAFAPLDQAKLVSALLGISAMAAIAVSWAGLLFLRRQAAVASEQKKIMTFLLIAFFYVFANACAVFLTDDHRVREIISWANIGFGLVFAVLFAVLTSKRPAPRAE